MFNHDILRTHLKELYSLRILADYLCGRLVNVIYERDRLRVDFENMCKNVPDSRLSEWSSMDTEPRFEDGQWISVYRHRAGPCKA